MPSLSPTLSNGHEISLTNENNVSHNALLSHLSNAMQHSSSCIPHYSISLVFQTIMSFFCLHNRHRAHNEWFYYPYKTYSDKLAEELTVLLNENYIKNKIAFPWTSRPMKSRSLIVTSSAMEKKPSNFTKMSKKHSKFVVVLKSKIDSKSSIFCKW